MLEREEDYDLSQRDIIASYLAVSKKCSPEPNTWESWIALLPEQMPPNVVAVTPEDLELLRGSHLYHKFQAFHTKLREVFPSDQRSRPSKRLSQFLFTS